MRTVLALLAGMTSWAVWAVEPAVVPKPQEMIVSAGHFTLTATTTIGAPRELASEAMYLVGMLNPATGFQLKALPLLRGQHADIALLLDATLKVHGPDAYVLEVTPLTIAIRGASPAGVFYGMQTLRQLLPADIEGRARAEGVTWQVPCVAIKDYPRFPWRGSMLDVARHFMTVDEVKRYLDLMALHKLNTFHWHLTDDQGWRIDIRKHPKLTGVGSIRAESPVEGNRNKGDGKPHSGFYTQDQIRDVVAYAAARHITVVPEIEMPGHARAALAAYPELGCSGGPYTVGTRWGVEPEVFCAGNDQVYRLLEDVLAEVLELFPSSFVHIGGDECPKTRWKACAKCQSRIKKLGLKDEHELQSHFVQHFDQWLAARSRRLIGWDEILEGGLAPGAAVMSWRGIGGGITAAKAGHDVVMSPTSHCYLDYSQGKQGEPETIGGFVPLKKVYSFEPVPADVPEAQRKHILGTQGNLWGEYLFNYPKVEYMAYPRQSALAEVAWTQPSLKNYDDFLRRMQALALRFDMLGVNYRKLTPEPMTAAVWKSGETTQTFTPRTWDVSPAITSPGTYEVTFKYTAGAHRLDMQWAAVLVNGKVANRDSHEGFTGVQTKENVYRIKVDDIPAGAKCELTASIRSDGGTDSNGEIYIARVGP